MTIRNIGDFVAALQAESLISDTLRLIDFVERPKIAIAFELWFRGERDATWSLQPKVFRKKFDERNLTNRFRVLSKSRHINVPNYENYGLFLSLMQHYSLPTRLLDWSTSPLIALYFAVEKYIYEPKIEPVDASVWILNPYKLNKSEIGEGTTPAIEGWSVRKFLRPAFSHQIPEKPDSDHIALDSDHVCAVMGSETDSRIFVQQGNFTIHTQPTALQSRQGCKSYLSKITIPKESVRLIATELALCGFRKSTIYPDLTNLATDLEQLF